MSDNGQEKQVLFEIKQLCKSFGPTKVLDHIDATIRQGEVVVIVGPSGSGKSTFLRSLNLLEMPTSGEILINIVRKSEWCSSNLICSQIRRFWKT